MKKLQKANISIVITTKDIEFKLNKNLDIIRKLITNKRKSVKNAILDTLTYSSVKAKFN